MPDNKLVDLLHATDFDLYLRFVTDNDLICNDCQNSTRCLTTCYNFERHKPRSVFLLNQCDEFLPTTPK